MKKIKQYKKIIIMIVIMGLMYCVYFYLHKPWQLSLYGDGKTLKRLNYQTKHACFSAGAVYIRGESTPSYDTFDCGYKCKYSGNINDLKKYPICSKVCNKNGCK